MFVIEREISSSEIEPVYQHVHHAKALCLLEEARLAYLEKIGFPNEKLLNRELFLVLTQVSVRYLREILAGRVLIGCQNPRVKSRLMSVEQQITLASGEVAVEGRIDFMCLSRQKGRAVVPPDDFRAAFLGEVSG